MDSKKTIEIYNKHWLYLAFIGIGQLFYIFFFLLPTDNIQTIIVRGFLPLVIYNIFTSTFFFYLKQKITALRFFAFYIFTWVIVIDIMFVFDKFEFTSFFEAILKIPRFLFFYFVIHIVGVSSFNNATRLLFDHIFVPLGLYGLIYGVFLRTKVKFCEYTLYTLLLIFPTLSGLGGSDFLNASEVAREERFSHYFDLTSFKYIPQDENKDGKYDVVEIQADIRVKKKDVYQISLRTCGFQELPQDLLGYRNAIFDLQPFMNNKNADFFISGETKNGTTFVWRSPLPTTIVEDKNKSFRLLSSLVVTAEKYPGYNMTFRQIMKSNERYFYCEDRTPKKPHQRYFLFFDDLLSPEYKIDDFEFVDIVQKK